MVPLRSPVLKKIKRFFGQREVRFPLTLVGILLGMVFFFALVFSQFEEGASFGDGLWTAYITLTTIGYGDFTAKTFQGRLTTVLTTLIGIGCFGVFTGIIVERALQRRLKKMKGESHYSGRDHLVIVNVPSYEEIRELLRELTLSPDFKDIPVVLVAASLPNDDKEIPGFLMGHIDGFVLGLPSTLETLERANLGAAQACVFLGSTGDPKLDDTNTLTAGLIEKNWPKVVTILGCTRAETLKNLDMFNINGGINATGLQMGLLVQELEDPGVFEVYHQLSSNAGGSQIYIAQTPVGRWQGYEPDITLGKLKMAILALNQPAEILGVKRNPRDEIFLNPQNDFKLEQQDRLIYLSKSRIDWPGLSVQLVQKMRALETAST